MLYLASQSPRRRQLLEQIGVAFEPLDIEVVERREPSESAAAYVRRVAHDKARAGLARVQGVADAWVLGADTEVVLADEVFGKPSDAADAAAMLARLAGREHQVISTVWLLGAAEALSAACISTVRFAPLDGAAIAAYVATGEPFGKAGAYAIQGRAATLIEHLQGSFSGVMGLPVFETAGLLRQAGLLA